MPQQTLKEIDSTLANLREGVESMPAGTDFTFAKEGLTQASQQLGQMSSTPTPMAAEAAEVKPPEPPVIEPQLESQLGLQAQLEKQRAELESFHQKELEQVNKELEEAKRQQQEFVAKQEGVLSEADPLTQPFRESIEQAERKRLQIEDNFFANQALTNELEGLLNESIAMTRKLQTQRVPGLAGIQQSTRMINAQQNIQARIGVIEAVMAARNNQIGVAQGFIDRTLGNIQQDRQDRLGYLNNLFNFYETSRNELGEKIFNLTKEQKDIINRQRALIEYDLQKSEQAAEQIEKIMLENPLMAAQAGLSLNDTEEEINKKIADWQYKEEGRSVTNKLMESGMRALSPQDAKMYDAERVFTYIDSKGVEQNFLIPKTADYDFKTSGGNLYRVNKQDGSVELVASGGQTPAGTVFTTTDEKGNTRELSSWELALELVSENRHMSDEELNVLLADKVRDHTGKTIMSDTERKTAIAAGRKQPPKPIELQEGDETALAFAYVVQNFKAKFFNPRGDDLELFGGLWRRTGETTKAINDAFNEINSWEEGDTVTIPGTGMTIIVTSELKRKVISELQNIPKTKEMGNILLEKKKELDL